MADADTSIGAGRSAFAQTQWSEILRARDPGAIGDLLVRLAGRYWRPVYKFLRIALGRTNDEAKDLTQAFFADVVRPEWVARADPARGSFRTFLLASLKNFVRDADKHDAAIKRGGAARVVPIDAVDDDPPARDRTPEEVYQRAWAEGLLAEALGELERELAGRERVFRAFREYCLDSDPGREISYESLARSLGVAVTDVTNYLAEARRHLRRILLARVGEYVSTEREAEVELRELFES